MIRPFPLFDSASEIRSGPLGLVGNQATKRLSEVVLEQTQIDRDWTSPYMKIARSFLKSHLPADGNSNTFNRFRSEIERFTLWLAIKHKKNPLELRHTDILDYLGFLEDPDRQWVSAYRTTRITYDNGVGTMNEGWCPFWARMPKGTSTPDYDAKKTKKRNFEIRAEFDAQVVHAYSPKASTIAAAIRALGAFYKYLIQEQLEACSNEYRDRDDSSLISDKILPNPVIKARKWFMQNRAVDNKLDSFGSLHCLTKRQWKFTLEAANELRMANPDRWTRVWFLIAFLKVSYLRVSEVCRSPTGTPKMNDIQYAHEFDCWVFHIRHNGKLQRKIALPDAILEYLEVYRRSRGFSSPFPEACDEQPLISKLPRWNKLGTDSEHKPDMSILPGIACEDINAVFRYTQSYIARQQIRHSKSYRDDIDVLKRASANWLRHTGATMAIEDGASLSDLQVGLGNSDPKASHDHYKKLLKAASIESIKGRKL
jgi:site-specific recombinase XerD